MSGVSSYRPDVVVLGMKSCGKTVFLSVLGMKLRLSFHGRLSTPFGFNVTSCDEVTEQAIIAAKRCLLNNKWPDATPHKQMTPLKFNVSTGNRDVFQLTSMDISGESFLRAFGGGHSSSPQLRAGGRKSQAGGEDDALLGNLDESNQQKTPDAEPSSEDEALRDAVRNAKVVCFFINTALPEGRFADLDERDREKVQSFQTVVDIIQKAFKSSEFGDLPRKSLVVLTQTHLHANEIDSVGAISYLGERICNGYAADLCGELHRYNVPVVAVSSVNETSYEGRNDSVPDRFESDGLLGFLLTVSGMVVPDDPLATVNDLYQEWYRARGRYLQSIRSHVLGRLESACRYRDACSAFVSGASDYVSLAKNLAASRGRADAPVEVDADECLASTLAAEELRKATDEGRKCVEENLIWDDALRKAAIRRYKRDEVSPKEIEKEVVAGFKNRNPDKDELPHMMIYGFEESGEWNHAWISGNVKDYLNKLKRDVGGLLSVGNSVCRAVDEMEPETEKTTGSDFTASRRLAEMKLSSLENELAAFCREWRIDGNSGINEIDELIRAPEEQKKRIDEMVVRHDKALKEAELRQARLAEQERRRRIRRRIVLSVLAAAGLGAAGLGAAWGICDGDNKRNAGEIRRAVAAHGDLDRAEDVYRSMRSIPWLRIDRDDHLCPGFSKRLAMTRKIKAACGEADGLRGKCHEAGEWLDGLDLTIALPEQVKEAMRLCRAADDGARKSFELRWDVVCKELTDPSADLAARLESVENAARDVKVALAAVENAKPVYDEALRSRKFSALIGEIDKRLDSVDGRIETTLKAPDSEVGEADAGEVLLELDRVAEKLVEAEKLSRKIEERQNVKSRQTRLEGLRARPEELRRKKFLDLVASLEQECRRGNAGLMRELLVEAQSCASGVEEINLLKRWRAELHGLEVDEILRPVKVACDSNRLVTAWNRLDDASKSAVLIPGGREKVDKIRAELAGKTTPARCQLILKEAGKCANAIAKAPHFEGGDVDNVWKCQIYLSNARDLCKRLPGDGNTDEAKRKIEVQADAVESRLPVIVQLECKTADGTPVDIKPAGSPTALLPHAEGVSPESKRECVFYRALSQPQNGESRFVRVLSDGRERVLAIPLFGLKPGINRVVRDLEK